MFEPLKGANQTPIFCHHEFLQKIEQNRNNQIGKRASLLLQHLIVDERRQHYKSTQGPNKGWRRSRLGGNNGSHFYAWWAPKGAPPVANGSSGSIPDGAVLLRDIRHHDDHSELKLESFEDNYLPVSVQDLRNEDYAPSPMTPSQSRFISARQGIRIVKGYPGSGKTTALWHAADLNSIHSTLYITYSKDLAALAKAHFECYAPGEKQFHVTTFSNLIRDLLSSSAEFVPERDSRAKFTRQLSGLLPRTLGPWTDDRKSLYDEVHANLIGAALPIAAGRFAACGTPRLSDRNYKELRRRSIGAGAVDSLLEVTSLLERRVGAEFGQQFFPELLLAWNACVKLTSANLGELASRKLLDFDCIAIDEVQDLTPIEALVFVLLAEAIQKHRGSPPTLLIAGDEAQTVRPTDFEWGWLNDLLHHRLTRPQEFKLNVNLRSPRRIAQLTDAVWGLYSNVSKRDRPSGGGNVDIADDASDQIIYCAATRNPDLQQLLTEFADREGLALICLEDEIPDYVPAGIRFKVLSVTEAKGLDFQAVCLLDPGKHLEKIQTVSEYDRRNLEVEPLSKRLAIDQLRVAISRPTERIYFLDVDASRQAGSGSLDFLRNADRDSETSPVIPAVVLKTLEEELLAVEERVRLCENDARQFLNVKPDMAWTRARQAVSLLGKLGAPNAVEDETVRKSANLTLAQVSFCIGFRNVRLSSELGRPDFYRDAFHYAVIAANPGLARIISGIASVERSTGNRTSLLIAALETMSSFEEQIEPWLSVEIVSRSADWLKCLEEGISDGIFTGQILKTIPFAYKLFAVLDADQRINKLRQKAVRSLMHAEQFRTSLEILEQDATADWKLVAECHEGLRDYGQAADLFYKHGNLTDALRNYRMIPDLGKTIDILNQLGNDPSLETLKWMQDVQTLLANRPASFSKSATAAEKKYMANLLEANMGAPRVKKPPVKRAAVKKAAKPRKKAMP